MNRFMYQYTIHFYSSRYMRVKRIVIYDSQDLRIVSALEHIMSISIPSPHVKFWQQIRVKKRRREEGDGGVVSV